MRGWGRHTAVIMGAIVAFMIAGALADWPWWEYAFRSDLSAVSWLSSALLPANSTVAFSARAFSRAGAIGAIGDASLLTLTREPCTCAMD